MRKNNNFFVHYGWLVLAVGTLAIFGALGLGRFGYSMVMPNMQAGLGINNGQAGLLATMGLIGYLALAIIGGALASRYGVRLVASLGLFFTGLGMLCMGLVRSFGAVAFWSGLSGIGSGAANVAIMGLWPSWFSKKRRGFASGVAVCGSSMGLISTGLLVPRIISAYGERAWQFSWLVFGAITLILAAGTILFIRNNPADVGLKPIGEGNGAELNTNTSSNSNTNTNSNSKPLARQGIVNWKQVYLSASVWYIGIVYIAFGFSYIVFMTFFVQRLVTDAGYTELSAGHLFTLMGWFSLPSGIVWGMISDYLGRKKTLIIIYLIHAIAFGLFAMGKSPAYFTISALLYGISAWSIPAIMAAICGDLLGPELTPAALGFITLFFGLGQVLGPVVAGGMADALGSFSPVFWLTSTVALAGAVSAGLLIKTPAHQATTAKVEQLNSTVEFID